MRANRAAARAADRAADIADRVVALDWSVMAKDLDAHGCAVTAPLLTPDECEKLAALYPADAPFRSRVIMARHGFGRGEYKYFAYPLPEPIAELRAALYPLLAEIANRWNEAMGIEVRYPASHRAYLDRCHKAGQPKPTPLLLQYGPGDYTPTDDFREIWWDPNRISGQNNKKGAWVQLKGGARWSPRKPPRPR